jgi:pimeloyl-ACP methyl ester carboxylesterase
VISYDRNILAAATRCHLAKAADVLRADINGLRIAYQCVGRGPAVVLLHGFTQDSRVWAPQLADLSDRFRVVAWDAPGAGQSDDPPSTYTIGDWADALAGLLDAEHIRRAHTVGLSWGGLLAQEFYRKFPSRVWSLVLADTYAGWTGSLGDAVAEQRLAACIRDSSLPARELVAQYLPGMFSERPAAGVTELLTTIMADTHPVGFRLMAAALAAGDTRELLSMVSVPTLLIWGDADKRSPIDVAHQLEMMIPGATLAVIPGVGHVSNLEAPATFNAVVREFLLSIGSGPRD